MDNKSTVMQIISKMCLSSAYSQQDISGLQDHEFQTRFPEAPAFLFQVRLGDEKLEVLSSNINEKTIGAETLFILFCLQLVY